MNFIQHYYLHDLFDCVVKYFVNTIKTKRKFLTKNISLLSWFQLQLLGVKLGLTGLLIGTLPYFPLLVLDQVFQYQYKGSPRMEAAATASTVCRGFTPVACWLPKHQHCQYNSRTTVRTSSSIAGLP